MPAYNDADDSDAWRDDESMTSIDELSSHHDDIESIEDSDYEFLTRSSSQALEDETDSDDLVSTDGSTSIITGVNTDDIESIVSSEDVPNLEESPADIVLRSTELPQVIRDNQSLDDSTVTITTPSISRHDTVTPLSETHTVEPHNAQPFNILYAGSASIKSTVLRKLGQSLMAATLKGRSPQDTPPSLSASASFITDWSSGCTSVVPITDFDTYDVAPEIEFVEDSLVKMRVQEIDTLHGFSGRRASHFLCQLDQSTRVVSCHHYRHQRRTVCPWFENPETCPSLVVYCSSGREEKTDVGLQKIEAFAEDHHFPLLVISDCERSGKLYCFNWNEGNVPVPEGGGRAVMLGYESLTFKKFLDLDSAEFGRSLWKGAVISQDAIKNAGKVYSHYDLLTLDSSSF
jgi:hypothetical protein